MQIQETNSWPEFFARAKKVGEVRYKTKQQMTSQKGTDGKVVMTPGEYAVYSAKDEDEHGEREMFFTTFADPDNAKYLMQLKIAAIKVGPKGEDSQQDANDLRLTQLEARVASLETQLATLARLTETPTSKLKPTKSRKKEK